MTLSIWRYSHLILAVSSAVFLVLASITGAILAIEPISQNIQSHSISGLDTINLSQTIDVLQNEYDTVLEIEVTPSNAVKANVLTKEGISEYIYINPLTGKKVADIEKKSPVFSWVTNLHRSLFLKGIGRFFVGFVSLLLCFIAVTGLLLLIKRQGGILKLYSKVKETNFNERYHVILGRWLLVPIIIIGATGVYLSAEKFSLLPESTIHHNYDNDASEVVQKKKIVEFSIFKNITLDKLRKLTFPFSEDSEDYFEIALSDKELLIHQYNGKIISEIPYPFVKMASQLSLQLHTGQGSIIWSLVLLIASLSILFFIYSGFSMSLKRQKKSKINSPKFDKDECDIVLLVGSETGNTYVFAKAFCKALIKAGKKVFLSSLNEYTTYKKATQLVVFTATYGDGEAPSNARNFESNFKTIIPENNMQFSVVGFGSKLYPNYCHFAIKTDGLLHNSSNFKPFSPLTKINEQSQSEFQNWIEKWSKQANITLQLKSSKTQKKESPFTVLKRTDLNVDNTFLLELKPNKNLKFQSGDLLSIRPNDNSNERLYSIAEIDKKIILSIKKHDLGICSSKLSQLNVKDMIPATIQQNKTFHFPENAKEVIMISNGTGIAPFLGMINNKTANKVKSYLFWGGRTKKSLKIYSELIDKAFYNQKLSGLFVSFSKEESQKKYVQNSITEKKDLICRVLSNNGIIMICGSIAMRNGVLDTLEAITQEVLKRPLIEFENNNQILTDCY